MVNNSLVQQQNKGTFSTYITNDAIKKKINEMIGGKEGQKFVTSIIAAVSLNPELAKCEHGSILSAAMVGAALKLSPSPQLGQFYMVPFKDKNKDSKVAQFQIGYKGYIQLAIRSGYYKKINVMSIKEGELKNFDPMNEEITVELIDDFEARDNAKTIGYYAMFEYNNGFRKCIYWSKKQMEAHAMKYSFAYKQDKQKGWSYSFWTKDFDGMAYKTLIRQLISKWGIMSVDSEMQQAYEHDTSALNNTEQSEFIDNENPTDSFFEQDKKDAIDVNKEEDNLNPSEFEENPDGSINFDKKKEKTNISQGKLI